MTSGASPSGITRSATRRPVPLSSLTMSDFDPWGREALADGDLDALLDFEHKAPAARQAHPRTEHFAPLFVTLGASDGDLTGARTVIDGFWYGLAKRSIEVS